MPGPPSVTGLGASTARHREPGRIIETVSELRVYNSLTRSIEPAVPRRGRPVTFYSCGPTVYDDAHIGNFRSFLAADVLRRTLELLGHRVHHVMNITDVGHMTEDDVADGGGEDKMAAAGRRIDEAKKAGKVAEGAGIDAGNPYAIAEHYATRFVEDACALGLKVAIEAVELKELGRDPGTLMPRPTRCVQAMIAMIEELVARGHAYVGRDGAAYFSVESFPAYGRLSGNAVSALREGAGDRVVAENQSAKRHPADFLLWKPDARHLMRWDSPWGPGYPGWHIECSAMARVLLGDVIDLHSGGEDNIFPHHECEIAQSCCTTGQPVFARTWFHVRHLQVEGAKMSKSRGNFFTARDIFARGVTPAALRLELVRTHYRSNANFTLQGLQDCQRMVDRWYRALESLSVVAGAAAAQGALPDEACPPGPFEAALRTFTDALCDDLNVARAIAALNEACAAGRSASAAHCPQRELASLLSMDSVLAVFGRNASQAEVPDADFAARIDVLVARRTAARDAKDWTESDRIRGELSALGVTIRDGPSGPTWTRS